MNELDDSIIEVDGVQIKVDGLSYEYAQQDGDQAGRTDDGTMIRDVKGMTTKIYCDINDIDFWRNEKIKDILKVAKKTNCNLKYFDLMEYKRIEKKMYVVFDTIKINKVGQDRLIEPFQMRFIQMDVDAL